MTAAALIALLTPVLTSAGLEHAEVHDPTQVVQLVRAGHQLHDVAVAVQHGALALVLVDV